MTAPNKNGKKTAERGPSGRFAKGNRASPGRPAGRGTVAELRDKLAKDLDQIIDVLRAQALTGDAQAIRILLDRVLPSLRPMELPTPLDIPKGNLAQQAHAVRDGDTTDDERSAGHQGVHVPALTDANRNAHERAFTMASARAKSSG